MVLFAKVSAENTDYINITKGNFIGGKMSEMEEFKKDKTEFNQVKTSELNNVVFVSVEEEQIQDFVNDTVVMNIAGSLGIETKDIYSDVGIDFMVDKIASAINAKANQKYKGGKFLEPCELEEIKKGLAFSDCNQGIKEVFEKELTGFQEKIQKEYVQQIREYQQKKIECENQIEDLVNAKKEIVMKRLSQMLWPYDEKTRVYDKKISALKIQTARYAQKIEQIESIRPAASEKDIIIFQMQLKEKFIG